MRVVRMAGAVSERDWIGKRLADQLLRAGTSVGAQYAEARGARSDAEFIAKVDGALQEIRETIYWMHLVMDVGLMDEARVAMLLGEANEICAMLTASSKTTKNRVNAAKKNS